MEIWRCILCEFRYDSKLGCGSVIPAGTKFEDIPEDWVCPICGAGKNDFRKIEFAQRTILGTFAKGNNI